jgi:hypothetical protein
MKNMIFLKKKSENSEVPEKNCNQYPERSDMAVRRRH